jgi:hypothetical protein
VTLTSSNVMNIALQHTTNANQRLRSLSAVTPRACQTGGEANRGRPTGWGGRIRRW